MGTKTYLSEKRKKRCDNASIHVTWHSCVNLILHFLALGWVTKLSHFHCAGIEQSDFITISASSMSNTQNP